MIHHWTNNSSKDFAFAVAMDFIEDIESFMEENKISKRELSQRLGVSEGLVRQVINDPGNLTLLSMVEWARALNLKVAFVAYNDEDSSNADGPIFAYVFRKCWEALGKPADYVSYKQTTLKEFMNETFNKKFIRAVKLEYALAKIAGQLYKVKMNILNKINYLKKKLMV